MRLHVSLGLGRHSKAPAQSEQTILDKGQDGAKERAKTRTQAFVTVRSSAKCHYFAEHQSWGGVG